MGLKQSMSSKDGVTHANSYGKIVSLVIDNINKTAAISLYWYHNKSSADELKTPIMGGEIKYKVRNNVEEPDPEDAEQTITVDYFDKYFGLAEIDKQGVNTLSQAYKYIKENDEVFADAEDVFEEGQDLALDDKFKVQTEQEWKD